MAPRRQTRSSGKSPTATPRRMSGRMKRAPERLSAPPVLGVAARRDVAAARRIQSARKRARSTTAAAVAAALDTSGRGRRASTGRARGRPGRKTPVKKLDHVGARSLVGKCIRIDWPCGDHVEDGEYTAMVYGYVERTGKHKIFYYKTLESEISCEELNLMDGSRSWELDTAPSLRDEELLEGMKSKPDSDPGKFVGRRVRVFWPDKKRGEAVLHQCEAVIVDIISESVFRLVYVEDDWVEDRDLIASELRWELVEPFRETDANVTTNTNAITPTKNGDGLNSPSMSTPRPITRYTTGTASVGDNCSTDTERNSGKDDAPNHVAAPPRGRVTRASVSQPVQPRPMSTRNRSRGAQPKPPSAPDVVGSSTQPMESGQPAHDAMPAAVPQPEALGAQSAAQAAALLVNSSPLAAAAAMVNASGPPVSVPATSVAGALPDTPQHPHTGVAGYATSVAQQSIAQLPTSGVATPTALHVSSSGTTSGSAQAPVAVVAGADQQTVSSTQAVPFVQHTQALHGNATIAGVSYPGTSPLGNSGGFPQAVVPQMAFVPQATVGQLSTQGSVPAAVAQPEMLNSDAVPAANPSMYDAGNPLQVDNPADVGGNADTAPPR